MDILPIATSASPVLTKRGEGGSSGGVNTPSATLAQTVATMVHDDVKGRDRVAQAIEQVNSALAQKAQNLYGTVDKDNVSGMFVFKIVDKETKEVVRQLPSKEVVAFAQSLASSDSWRGLLLKAKI